MRYEAVIRRTFEVVGTSGKEFLCRCKWHDDKSKPNLYINGVSGLFLCQSCGKKGSLDNIADIPAPKASDLTDRIERFKMKNDCPGRVYTESWLKRFNFEHDYWKNRGFTDDTVADFQLGFDPVMNRVTIPVRSEKGQLLGVVQRVLDDSKPRYRYPRGFPIGKHLFGSWKINNQRKVALVEGTLDAVSCWEARVPGLALLGSRITNDQVSLLKRLSVRTVAVFTDNDAAGIAAIDQIHERLHATGILTEVVVYRKYWGAKDPGDLTPQRIRKGFHSSLPWHRWTETNA